VTPVPKCKQCSSLSHCASHIIQGFRTSFIVSDLHKNKLLSAHQSGFRAGYSTQDVLLYVTDKWLRAIDEGKYTGAVFLDLAKAFDPVDHVINTVVKLRFYGF